MAFGEALLVVGPGRDRRPVARDAARPGGPAQPGDGGRRPERAAARAGDVRARRSLGGLVALVALTIPTLASGVSIAGVRAAVGRQAGRTLPQRLGLDLALVVLAVIAMLQLRLYGATLTRNARGTLGVDPLLVAAPGDRPARRARSSRSGSCPASRSSRERVLARTRGLDRIARQPAGRAPAAALHARRAAADPRRGARHVRVGPRRDLDAEPGRPGGVDRRARTSGSSPRPPSDIPAWATRRRAAGDPGRDGGDAGREGGGRHRVDDPRRHARRRRRRGDGRRRPAARRRRGRGDARRAAGAGRAGARPTPGHRAARRARAGSRSRSTRRSRPSRASSRSRRATTGLTASALARRRRRPGRAARGRARADRRRGGRSSSSRWHGRRRPAPTGPLHLIGLDVGAVDRRASRTAMAQGQIDLTGSRRAPTTRATPGRRSTSPRPAAAGPRTQGGNRHAARAGRRARRHAARRARCPSSSTYAWDLTVPPAARPRAAPDRSSTRRSSTGPAPRSATQLHASVFGVPVTLDLVARVDAFPPLDQTKPFVARRRRWRSTSRGPGAGGSIVDRGRVVAVGRSGRRRTRSPRRCGRRRSSADDVVDTPAVTADLAGDPLGLGRDRDPRARVARRARVRVDRLPRERDGVDLGADRRVRAAQGARARRRASCCCGSRSRTSLLLVDGPGPRHAARAPARVARAAVRDAHPDGRAAGPGAGRSSSRPRPPSRRIVLAAILVARDGRAGDPPAARRRGRARSCARGTSSHALDCGSPSGGSATTVAPRSGSPCSCSSRRSSPRSRRGCSPASPTRRSAPRSRSAPVVGPRASCCSQNRIVRAGPADDPLAQVRDGRATSSSRPFPASIRALVAGRTSRSRAAASASRRTTTDPAFVRLRIQEGDRATTSATSPGRPPTGAVTTRDDVGPEPGRRRARLRGGDLGRDRATRSGSRSGETVPLVGDPGDQLIGRTPRRPATRSRRSPASTRRSIPTTDYWLGDPQLIHPVIRALSLEVQLLDAALLVDDATHEALAQYASPGSQGLRYSWRDVPRPRAHQRARRSAGLITDFHRLLVAVPVGQRHPVNGHRAADRAWPRSSRRTGRRWAAAEGIIAVMALGPALVAVATLALIAVLAARRRRATMSLARSRGASGRQVRRSRRSSRAC